MLGGVFFSLPFLFLFVSASSLNQRGEEEGEGFKVNKGSKKKAVTLKEFFFLKLPSYLFVEAKYAVFLLGTPPQSFPLNVHRLLFKHT